MYKIGEFSILAKTSIKTLRYYESENLLLPSHIDTNNYRYYDSDKLEELIKIISLRQLGCSIKQIKKILNDNDLISILQKRKVEIEKELIESNSKLKKINNLLEGKNMNYEIVLKELPDYTVYYQEGVIKDFNEITNFILSSAKECQRLNPSIKCVEPDYCYVGYLDKEYKNKNIKIRYAQAVTKEGIGNDSIHFEKLKPVEALCIYHKGPYEKMREAYDFILKYIKDNDYEIIDYARERYIDGMWNKEDTNDWLTEIQFPVKKK